MADVTPVVETATNDKPAGDATGRSTSSRTLSEVEGQTAEGKAFTQADVDRIIKERLDREQRKAQDAQQKAVADAEAKALAEQGKFKELYEKQQADLQASQQRIKAMEIESLRKGIATKLGLPEALHDRLRGETAEDIERDAKTLLESIPKPTAPNINSNPGGGAIPLSTAALLEQRRETDRIYVPF